MSGWRRYTFRDRYADWLIGDDEYGYDPESGEAPEGEYYLTADVDAQIELLVEVAKGAISIFERGRPDCMEELAGVARVALERLRELRSPAPTT